MKFYVRDTVMADEKIIPNEKNEIEEYEIAIVTA